MTSNLFPTGTGSWPLPLPGLAPASADGAWGGELNAGITFAALLQSFVASTSAPVVRATEGVAPELAGIGDEPEPATQQAGEFVGLPRRRWPKWAGEAMDNQVLQQRAGENGVFFDDGKAGGGCVCPVPLALPVTPDAFLAQDADNDRTRLVLGAAEGGLSGRVLVERALAEKLPGGFVMEEANRAFEVIFVPAESAASQQEATPVEFLAALESSFQRIDAAQSRSPMALPVAGPLARPASDAAVAVAVEAVDEDVERDDNAVWEIPTPTSRRQQPVAAVPDPELRILDKLRAESQTSSEQSASERDSGYQAQTGGQPEPGPLAASSEFHAIAETKQPDAGPNSMRGAGRAAEVAELKQEMIARQPVTRMVLDIDAKALPVKLRLQHGQGPVSIAVHSPEAAARETLRSELGELLGRLRAAGYSEVSAGPSGTENAMAQAEAALARALPREIPAAAAAASGGSPFGSTAGGAESERGFRSGAANRARRQDARRGPRQ